METNALVDTVGDFTEYNEKNFFKGEEFIPRAHVNRLLSELCVLKILRPDRMVATLNRFMLQHLDSCFVDPVHVRLVDVYQDTDAKTPIFFLVAHAANPYQ